MAYDPELYQILSDEISTDHDFILKKMFGGIVYFLNGHMCFGIYKDFLKLRIGITNACNLTKNKHKEPMNIAGKIIKGWAMIAPKGYEDLKNQYIHYLSKRGCKSTSIKK